MQLQLNYHLQTKGNGDNEQQSITEDKASSAQQRLIVKSVNMRVLIFTGGVCRPKSAERTMDRANRGPIDCALLSKQPKGRTSRRGDFGPLCCLIFGQGSRCRWTPVDLFTLNLPAVPESVPKRQKVVPISAKRSF